MMATTNKLQSIVQTVMITNYNGNIVATKKYIFHDTSLRGLLICYHGHIASLKLM